MPASADEAELLELIHRNRIAVWMQDYELYQSCFVHAPYATRWNASRRTGIFVRESWDEISDRLRIMFATEPQMKIPANAYETTVENLVLRVDGDIAWARFNQRYPGIPSRVHNRAYSREIRIFERHDGRWKIAFLGYLDDEPGPDDRVFIELDPTGRIIWQGQAAAGIVADDRDFTVRGGHLHLRDTAADRRLQAAIRWAAERDKSFLPGRGAVPIVLEGGQGVPAKVWWVIADGDKIWFSLGDPRLNDARLAAASAIYGLSPAQQKVAGLIVEGLSLGEIGDRLGISITTTRTHLTRVFDKTGVRTQPALVRVLLSTAAPV
jgi:DNA-binding CsgD family transcriptional regulator